MDKGISLHGSIRPLPDSGTQLPELKPSGSRLDKEPSETDKQGSYISISERQLIKAIERAVKAAEGHNTYLDFSIHEKTKQIMVKVVNAETGEVIREIPPEQNLDFLARVWEKIGILVDEKK